MRPISFYDWLQGQVWRADPVGEVAQLILGAGGLPETVGTCGETMNAMCVAGIATEENLVQLQLAQREYSGAT